MKICYLGSGAWGFALADLLAKNGHEVVGWSVSKELAEQLNTTHIHPSLPEVRAETSLRYTTDLDCALQGADVIVESVTSAGIRPVFSQIREHITPKCPIIFTSKGIEQNSGFILPDILIELFGEEIRSKIGIISGPSYAIDVIKGLPTSVVGAAYDKNTLDLLTTLFSSARFRVYPNEDVVGVSLGGALKNVIAIACGIAEGLCLGNSARAALMTRGLHEICKLILACGGKTETVYGLAGMGDLCLTSTSLTSRNYKFGYLIALGRSLDEAKREIGMAVEGAYTALSALQLAKQHAIPMPIAESVYQILFEGLEPERTVNTLMSREVKLEHL